VIQSITRRRRRQSDSRITLVGFDGKPLPEPDATTWPASTDSHFWECGESSHDLAGHITAPSLDPDDVETRRDGSSLWAEMMIEQSLPPVESDAEFLARLAHEEAAEKARVIASYPALPQDWEEYSRWAEALDAGTLDAAEASHFSLGERRAIQSGQVSETELAMLASHGAI
jgi:hypothetical protein